MIKNVAYIYLLCLLLLISCNLSDKQPHSLICADRIMQTAPDSSLILLENFSDSVAMAKVSTQAWYALLLTQAHDRNYIRHTNDSLIRTAVDYYDSKNDVARQAKSHYYWGRVHQDLRDAPKTVREFMTALPLAEKAKDGKLLCLLHSNLGYVFYRQGMYEEADSMYVLAEQLAVQRNDSSSLAAILSVQGDILMELGEAHYASSESVLKRALAIADTLNNVYIEETIMVSFGYLYCYMGNPLEAIRFSKLGMKLQKDDIKRYDYDLIQGRAYDNLAQYDSAEFYLLKSLCTANNTVKKKTYRSLAAIARKQKRFDDALRLTDSCRAYTDSVRLEVRDVEIITSVKDILIQQTAYRYDSFLHRYQNYMYLGGIVLFLLMANFIYRRTWYKSLAVMLETSETEKKRLEQLYICQNAVLEQKRELCVKMEAQRVQLESEVQLLTERMSNASQEDAIELRAQMARLLNEKEALFRELMKVLPVYKLLQDVMKVNKSNPDAKVKLPEKHWVELKAEIDRISGDFTIRLDRKYELFTENDIRFCCLLKLGLKYSELALLYGCEPNAMYKRRDTILKKLPVTLGEVKLEELIRSL